MGMHSDTPSDRCPHRQLNTRVPEDLYVRLRTESARSRVTAARIVTEALRAYLAAPPNERGEAA